jgi:hypothetical protein
MFQVRHETTLKLAGNNHQALKFALLASIVWGVGALSGHDANQVTNFKQGTCKVQQRPMLGRNAH